MKNRQKKAAIPASREDQRNNKREARKSKRRDDERDARRIKKKNAAANVEKSPELKPSNNKNCLFCRRFRKCTDINKNWKYICDRYKPFPKEQLAVLANPEYLNKKDRTEAEEEVYQADANTPDYERMINSVLKMQTGSPLPPDMKIDDRDIPRAKNIFEFLTGKEFLNIEPFAKQLEAGIHLFAEFCPNKKCSDPDYIWDIPKKAKYDDILDRVQLLEFGVCPKCGARKSELYRSQKLKVPVELAGLAGQRSGKSKFAVMCHMYVTHGFMKLQNPVRVFGLLDATILRGTFTAQSATKAKELLFDDFYHYSKNSPWFSSYNSLLDHYGKVYGEELYKIMNTYVQYRPRSLFICPRAPDKKALRGDTSYCLDGNSFVSTNNGLIKIKNSRLVGDYAQGYGKNTKIIKHIPNGEKNLRRVTLKNGLRLKLTNDHKIMVLENHEPKWKLAEDIKIGDFVAVNVAKSNSPKTLNLNHGITLPYVYTKTSKFNSNNLVYELQGNKFAANRRKIVLPNKMTKELAYLLGYMVSEGCNTLNKYGSERNEFTFVNTNRKVIDHFVECYKACFGATPSVVDCPVLGKRKLHAWIVSLSYKPIKQFLRWCGLKNKKAKKKTIPHVIMQAPNDAVLAFFDAYFEGDGCYTYKNVVSWTSYSPRILQQMQLLLLRLGYVSSICRKNNYVALFGTEAYNYFHDNCKLGCKNYKYSDRVNRPNYRIIPDTKIQILDGKYHIYTNSKYNEEKAIVSYKRRFPEKWKKLEKLIDNDIIWVPVKNNKQLTKKKKVYDITVKSSDHSFTANGIIVHNCGSVDEIGWFDSSEKGEKNLRTSGKEVYTALKNSFRTLKGSYYDLLKRGYDGLPIPLYANISSPSSKKDMIVRNYELSKKSRFIFGFHHSTWEFNPTISRRDLEDEFSTDPIKAMRDFGAVPPNSSYPYISDVEYLKAIVDKSVKNTVKASTVNMISQAGREMRTGKLRFLAPKDSNKRILAIDAGFSGNSFAMVAGYKDENSGKPIMDTFLEIVPTTDYPLNFNAVFEDVMLPLIERLNVKYVVFDRWQNLKLMHDLEESYEVLAEQYSVKYRDFEACRSDIYEGGFSVPRPELKPSEIENAGAESYPMGFNGSPVAHCLFQILTVQDLGKEVIKGDGVTDDLFRAMVLAYAFIVDPQFAEYCTGKVNSHSTPSLFAGTYAGRGIGKFTGGNGSGGNVGSAIMGSNGGVLGVMGSYGSNRR